MFVKDSIDPPCNRSGSSLCKHIHRRGSTWQKRNHLFQRSPRRLDFSSAMRKVLSKSITVRQQLLCRRGSLQTRIVSHISKPIPPLHRLLLVSSDTILRHNPRALLLHLNAYSQIFLYKLHRLKQSWKSHGLSQV